MEDDRTSASAEEDTEPKAKARPWWTLPLLGLSAITLGLLALFVTKTTAEHKPRLDTDAADARVERANASATPARTDPDADTTSGSDDAGTALDTDASAGDAAADVTSEDGIDGGRDAGSDATADDDHAFAEATNGDGGSGGVIVKIGPGGGGKTEVHRGHSTEGAIAWRVAAGAHKVSRTEAHDRRFDVWLTSGQNFEGVRVEWQDKAGAWHVH
ncbi:MAG TPA: hypothetical protein VM925_00315 [Labilithrix sp.]|nr:hypothetical protein [Labilithrix sp.]